MYKVRTRLKAFPLLGRPLIMPIIVQPLYNVVDGCALVGRDRRGHAVQGELSTALHLHCTCIMFVRPHGFSGFGHEITDSERNKILLFFLSTIITLQHRTPVLSQDCPRPFYLYSRYITIGIDIIDVRDCRGVSKGALYKGYTRFVKKNVI